MSQIQFLVAHISAHSLGHNKSHLIDSHPLHVGQQD